VLAKQVKHYPLTDKSVGRLEACDLVPADAARLFLGHAESTTDTNTYNERVADRSTAVTFSDSFIDYSFCAAETIQPDSPELGGAALGWPRRCGPSCRRGDLSHDRAAGFVTRR
jgi:hypothetical protein